MIRPTVKAQRVALVVALAGVVSAPQVASADHNWDCQGAHLIPDTWPYTGSVATGDLDDWYLHPAFPLPVHVYTLTMTGGDADLYVWAECTANGNAGQNLLCYSNRPGSATDECTAVGQGNHRIEVRYYSGGTVRYRLTASTL